MDHAWAQAVSPKSGCPKKSVRSTRYKAGTSSPPFVAPSAEHADTFRRGNLAARGIAPCRGRAAVRRSGTIAPPADRCHYRTPSPPRRGRARVQRPSLALLDLGELDLGRRAGAACVRRRKKDLLAHDPASRNSSDMSVRSSGATGRTLGQESGSAEKNGFTALARSGADREISPGH